MWYISFGGGPQGVNNILVYHDSGNLHSQSDLLPTGGSNPPLQELRGFVIAGTLLYVVNAYKCYSQILVYEADGNGDYRFEEIFASRDRVNSLLHSYDLTFDAQGNCYASSQGPNDAAKGVLYIGSSGNDSVVSYDLAQGIPPGIVLLKTFIDGEVKHVSGMAFDAEGCFYAAERKAKKIKKFPPDGSGRGKDFITNLPDEPEFILYVPK